MEAVNLAYALRASSRLRKLSVWHAVKEGGTRTACGLPIPAGQERTTWDETPEPRCGQCQRRNPQPR
jgi:hypothetical protein